MCGSILKPITMEIVDDVFSTMNEIETNLVKREFVNNVSTHSFSEIISNELSLNDTETAIDEVVSNLNINSDSTNYYVKSGVLFVEGIVSSNLTYIDENKEIKTKQIQVPFVLNTKIATNNPSCINIQTSVLDTKLKIKRGTIIEIEYSLHLIVGIYEKETAEFTIMSWSHIAMEFFCNWKG